MIKTSLQSLLLFLCFLACTSETSKSESSGTDVSNLPNTPESVAKVWIEAFYENDFKTAKALGTLITQAMIDSVRAEMQIGAEESAFQITDMTCQVKGDSAFCACLYHEEGEQYPEFILLLKEKGQWLVNDGWEE